mmetsp:Transcript_46356/g.83655  ORF Transcript_46356/g.83655 Transcript_46356/m.83655 type:complete len:224 (+) Transcript_46356:166-837(+)|eukprot:CAMPEP_0197669804 /NCGR_PEP_ID=MMETSP1338-20131121/72998_1 /TAXON_ID=43686 ORGANISM="Pelagodinium beii, Strain RCC1491" /NCGR_SAMPLE_ID=MMETSP1338 /ASSEMBLY_ACC=CAM_ASM_000754 /LENGTH=223 /DNA_ID=CAMNT_0043249447 /DNA_START=83 /DNA_END=754 /DNA_ORIENTATION=-
MVIPLGGVGGAQPNHPVPDVVKNKIVYAWYFIALLLIAAVVGEIMAKDPFAALFMGILAGVVIYMVKGSCQNMSMYCLLMMGVMSSFQAVFDLITVLMAVNGRRTQSTVAKNEGEGTTTYTTQVKTHPFFDKTAGLEYNVESAMMIASPCIMLLIVLAAYYSYQAFPNSMFEDGDSESAPMSRDYGAGAYRNSYGGVPPAAPPASRASAAPQLFQGQGQRLGS